MGLGVERYVGLGTGDQYMVAVVAGSPQSTLSGPSLSSVAQSLENTNSVGLLGLHF